jgi:hypothetical protein
MCGRRGDVILMAEIDILDNDTRVGKIFFDEHPTSLKAERTATGFNLTIPTNIGLKSASENDPRLAVKNLRLIFFIESKSASNLEVGRLHHDEVYSAYVNYRNGRPSETPQKMDLVWSATFPSLIAIERARESGHLKLQAELQAELCYIIICNHMRKSSNGYPVFTMPQQIGGSTAITYPEEVWNEMVQNLLMESRDDPYLMLLPLSSFLSGSS